MSTTNPRASGILLHPTSLPGRWGIGDLGDAAYQFVDALQAAGQQLWQVMPLGPTGYGDSPYQSFSAFAGNPLLISFDLLLSEGLLSPEDLTDMPALPDHAVDYGAVITFKQGVLRRSFERFSAGSSPELRQAFNDFLAQSHTWLNDYALFAALKQAHGGASWNTWDGPIARHEPEALVHWSRQLSSEVQFHSYLQFLFQRQWLDLKSYANQRGVRIIGDIPIFVAYDSADVWANPDLFWLDEGGNPLVVAGVPPDYFSATGQRWGNPLYRWDVLAKRGYTWWIERFRSTLVLYDIARIDHFRGFAGYWEVPAEEETAINGRWVAGPGRDLFDAVHRALGSLPIIAEDLGLITPDVIELRDSLGFPGMKVLQFAFGGRSDDPYLPHSYLPRSVVYTGTHDNDTTRGWWNSLSDHERSRVQVYLGRDGSDISWDLIRLALMSVADLAIIPVQDVLDLDSSARMNTPGQAGGNWSWRMPNGALSHQIIQRLHQLTVAYGRLPAQPE
jgi:4-alpha-glucanotransferase